MSRARILIVGAGHLCRNPRIAKEAETLGRAGFEVTVLTVRSHAPSVPLDAAMLRDAPYRCEVVDLLEGPGAFLRRLSVWAARKNSGWLRGALLARTLGPVGALLRRARARRADLTIVHNETCHWVGVQLLAAGRRVSADIEDWHSEDLLPKDRARLPLALIRSVERDLLNRAVHTTTTSHALSAALHARYGGRRPHIVTNSFPLQPDPHTAPSAGAPAFFWFSQTLGPGRGLELFFDGWARMTEPSRVVLLGESRGEYRASLLARVPAERRGHLSFLPLVPPAELPSVIARHDIGLALEQSFIPNRDLTITNKILQYLNAGLAVVASDTAGQREVLAAAPDAGVIVDLSDTAALAAKLDALVRDRTGLAHRQHAARRAAEQHYCWEKEAPKLLAFVESALASPAA